MRRILLLAVFTALQSLSARAESVSHCHGETWRQIEARVGIGSDLKQTVGFLRNESLRFDSVDLADHANEPRVQAYKSQGITPGCSIYVSQWLPLDESETECFPFATRTSEFISIDFDTNGEFIGLRCSSAIVKMFCEDAGALVDPGKRESAATTQEHKGPFGLPVSPSGDCADIQNLN